MRYLVCHRGIPVGAVDLSALEFVIADLEPTAAFEGIRGDVLEASKRMWDAGFDRRGGRGFSGEVLLAQATIAFELRTIDGRAVNVGAVNVVARRDPTAPPAVVVQQRAAGAGVVAVTRPETGADGSEAGVGV